MMNPVRNFMLLTKQRLKSAIIATIIIKKKAADF